MKRPTIADLARAANVSLSTVDRVINGRGPVRADKAEQVLKAAREIGFRAAGVIQQRLTQERPERTFGFILQRQSRPFYRLVGKALEAATRNSPDIRGRPRIEYLDDLTPASVSQCLSHMGRSTDAIAVVSADHPRVTHAIDDLAAKGIPVFALISDLTAQSRAGYIGLDNSKVGRTAAWQIANMCKQPGKVAIFVGSHRYCCQDTCEMSFRSYFREHAPEFTLLEPLTSLEDPRFAYANTLDLLKRNPDLSGLFVAGGGVEGVIQALQDENAFERIVTVALDLTSETRAALVEGVVKIVLSHPLELMAQMLVKAMNHATTNKEPANFQPVIVPFDIFTPENV